MISEGTALVLRFFWHFSPQLHLIGGYSSSPTASWTPASPAFMPCTCNVSICFCTSNNYLRSSFLHKFSCQRLVSWTAVLWSDFIARFQVGLMILKQVFFLFSFSFPNYFNLIAPRFFFFSSLLFLQVLLIFDEAPIESGIGNR